MDATLSKGLWLLEVLAASDQPRGAADLARELRLTRSNVFRLLKTLAAMGFARRADENGHYAATLKAWEVGMKIMSRDPLRRVAQPWLRALHHDTGGNVFLVVLDAPDVLYLDKVEAETVTRVSAQPGMRLPALLVASGRILSAYQTQRDVRTAARKDPRTARMANATLFQELANARRQGFAVTRDGSRPDVMSVAAPVFGGGDRPVAAIAVSVPARASGDEARLAKLLGPLLNGAARVSEALGHTDGRHVDAATRASASAREKVAGKSRRRGPPSR